MSYLTVAADLRHSHVCADRVQPRPGQHGGTQPRIPRDEAPAAALLAPCVLHAALLQGEPTHFGGHFEHIALLAATVLLLALKNAPNLQLGRGFEVRFHRSFIYLSIHR